MLINKAVPQVVVPQIAVELKEGHSYAGVYRVEVTHLPKSLLTHLIVFVVFTAAFIPLAFAGASQWFVWPCGVIAAEALMNMIIRATQLVRAHSQEWE